MLTMSSRRPGSLHDLFAAAFPLPPGERADFLREQCPDPETRARVLEMFERHARLDGFLEDGPIATPTHLGLGPGERVDDFELTGYHAHGGRGVVFRARQLSVGGREVALKVVPVVVTSQRSDGARPQREAEFAARVAHPHLVPVYAAGVDTARNLSWCAMQFVDGPTLQGVLEHLSARGRAPTGPERADLVRRIIEVALGAGAMHAVGLVHRDIKPANILLEGGSIAPPWRDSAVLVDFGLARRFETSTTHTAAATLAYAAPEQREGRSVDPRADVFALGLTLHDLLLGRARAGDTERGVIADVPSELAAVLRCATAVDLDHRYRDGAAFAADLERWLAGLPVAAGSRIDPRALDRRAGSRGRRRTLVALAILGLLAAVIGVVTWLESCRLQRAFDVGDLATIAAARSSWWWRQHLPEPVASDLEWRAIVRDVPFGEPARFDAALRRAAAWIGRDGPAAAPELVRFLAFEIAAGGDRGLAATAMAARLLYERPPEDSRETAAYAAIVAACWSVLAGEQRPILRAYAAAAIGGAAADGAFVRLLGMVRDDLMDHRGDEERLECARVMIEAAAAVVRRAGAAARPWLVDSRPSLLDLLGDDFGASATEVVGHAVTQLAVDWVLALRRCGEALPAEWPAPAEMPLELRAAIGGASVRDELLAAGPAFNTVALVAPPSLERTIALSWGCRAFGRRLGLLPGSEAIARGRALVEDAAAEHRFSGESALRMYYEGVERAAARVAGDHAEDRPDRDSGLAALVRPVRFSAPRWVRAAPVDDSVRVVADFLPQPAQLSGVGNVDAWLTDATIDAEPGGLRSGYCRLPVAGRSAIVMAFEAPGPPAQQVGVRVELQKGSRTRLPRTGRVALEFLLDGEVVQTMATPARGPTSIEIVLSPWLAPGPHVFELRLAEASETTMRVYRVTVEAK